MSDIEMPKISVVEMQRLMAAELSLRSRLGYTALMLVALGASGVIGSLWLTEPSLPARTQIAFALMIGIGLSWVTYCAWVLTRRQVLLAGHRIIAARMAIAFSAIFVAGSLALAVWGSAGRPALAAAGFGAVMLTVAFAILLSARRRFEELMKRRDALQRAAQ